MSNDNNLVCKIIADNKCKKVVEVGVWAGNLSVQILNSCPLIEEFYLVDPLSAELNDFDYNGSDHPPIMNKGKYTCNMGGKTHTQTDQDNMYNSILEKIKEFPATFYREESKNAAPRFKDNSLDFVFIDAIHLYENVKEDISLWLPKLKTGGILCGDDCTNRFPGVQKAVEEMFEGRANIKNGIWSIKK